MFNKFFSGAWSKTISTVDSLVKPTVVNKVMFRTFSINNNTDYFGVVDSLSINSLPKALANMVNHVGYVRVVNNRHLFYVLTHVLPTGVPGVKLDKVDYAGHKLDQYLAGPFDITNAVASGKTDSILGIGVFNVFADPNTYPAEAAKLLLAKNYFSDPVRDNIKEYYMSVASVKPIDLLKQLYTKYNTIVY